MELRDAAHQVLEPLGYEVLELNIISRKNKRRVLLRIDRLDEALVSVEDVKLASDIFSLELDRLDPFDGPYALEVESPGSKRPLNRQRHFERFQDLRIRVKRGNATTIGIVRSADDRGIVLEHDGERENIAYSTIDQARLDEWPETPR